MSAPRAAMLALVALRCPRPLAPSTKLQLQLHGATGQRCGALFVVMNARLGRYQSTSANSQKPDHNPRPPRPSARLLLTALRQSLGSLGSTFRGQNLRILYRQNPEELVIALAVLVVIAGLAAYLIRIYFVYFNSEQFTRYPPPIAKSLRRALYYSNYRPDAKLALRYYQQALEQCDELRLDPFSDDVMGIKIQLAAWLEKISNYNNSIKVLEALLTDCKRWVEAMEKRVSSAESPAQKLPTPGQVAAGQPEELQDHEPKPETLWGRRTRVLGKAVGISVKLGELYSDEHVLKPELAHERLTWAVETALKELHRRSVDGVKDGEGAWMDSEAIGGALEALAHNYETKSQFDLAIPLFLQALRLCRDRCHSAVLMNNLAASFAQHPVQTPYDTGFDAISIPKSLSSPNVPSSNPRAQYLEAARRWALNANMHATEPEGQERTAECDQACAASLCNLGDIASIAGDVEEARRKFEECISFSNKMGFSEGVSHAEEGLRRLERKIPSRP